MRIAVTLDDDVLALIHRWMRERGVSFETAINEAIRDGVEGRPAPTPFATRTADLGVPTVSLDHTLQIVAELEDDALIGRQRRGA
jgi:hypothetical protein